MFRLASTYASKNVSVNLRMWRNWQTRRFQVPVGDHMGSSPFIRTILYPVEPVRGRLGIFFYKARYIMACFCFTWRFYCFNVIFIDATIKRLVTDIE